MTSPGTMKTIQKRFYTVVTSNASTPSVSRVRSNSASRSLFTANTPLSFFDSLPPPPPSSRPGNPNAISTTRLPVKGDGTTGSGEGQQHHTNTGPHPPYSLALTSPQANNQSPSNLPVPSHQGNPFFPFGAFPHPNTGTYTPFYNASSAKEHPPTKRQRTRYQLDVGAYGIAKRSSAATKRSHASKSNSHAHAQARLWEEDADDLSMAVQVGEDAYFIRDNAMGVADGVGGWARARNADVSHTKPTETPSALFARRLMNFCSQETEEALTSQLDSSSRSQPIPIIRPMPVIHSTFNPSWPWTQSQFDHAREYDQTENEDDCDVDPMEELEEGLDVLMILERAYEKTIKAHVVPAEKDASLKSIPEDIVATSHQATTSTSSTESTTALLQGSSTALLAVLDHSPRSSRPQSRSLSPAPTSISRASSPSRLPSFDVSPHDPSSTGGGPVLKIAHLGDCMGMLVRGDTIVWRSEEMWWSFNTPVQLGPVSPSKPSTHAQTFTLPIEQDDILILASDGLSDNLWDEEVLDEVVRFRKSFLDRPSAMGKKVEEGKVTSDGLLGRRTMAGMLSEALCSRARRVSERRPRSTSSTKQVTLDSSGEAVDEFEVPFGRRAREQGRVFRGGKVDDISVVVAVISPADNQKSALPHT